MTKKEFKDELYIIRDNCRQMRCLLESIKALNDTAYECLNNGVVDYSKDRLQKTVDPDKAMIEAIDNLNRKRELLLNKYNNLQARNERTENLILSIEGINGEILRLYFMEGLTMKATAKRVNYSESYTWQLWSEEIDRLYKEGLSNEE